MLLFPVVDRKIQKKKNGKLEKTIPQKNPDKE